MCKCLHLHAFEHRVQVNRHSSLSKGALTLRGVQPQSHTQPPPAHRHSRQLALWLAALEQTSNGCHFDLIYFCGNFFSFVFWNTIWNIIFVRAEQTPQTCAGRLFIFIVNQSVYLIWCSCGYIYSIYVLQPCVNICKQIYINIYIIYMRLNLVKFFQESSRDHDFLSLIEVSH